MADTVANTVVYNSRRRTIINSVFTIDGTEAADLVLADLSAFTGSNGAAATAWVIEKIVYHITGMQILLEFEHSTDSPIAYLSGDGEIDYAGRVEDTLQYPGFKDPGSGTTGDIVATTLNSDAGDTAHITLFLRKKP